MTATLENIPNQLIQKATVVGDQCEIEIDRLVHEQIPQPVNDDDQDKLIEENPTGYPMSFLTRSGDQANAQEIPTDSSPKELLEAELNCINIEQSAEPINEFEENHHLLYSAFPHLFPLGKGLRRTNSVPQKDVYHMENQWSGKFAKCLRFQFLLFDQMQRHSAARAVKASVLSNTLSMTKFSEMIANPAFIGQLEHAKNHPNTTEAKALLAKMTPHISLVNRKVPYSAAERKAAVGHLMNMVRYFGPPTIFNTISQDDIHGLLNIRLTLNIRNNATFPATEDGFAEALRQQQTEFHSIPIHPSALRILLAEGPAFAANMYYKTSNSVFSHLFGTPPDSVGKKKTVPLAHRKAGIFGTPIAAFGCTEEQSRGSLHMHSLFCGGLTPSMIQAVGGIPILAKHIASAINRTVMAQLQPEIHVRHLLRDLHNESPAHAALFKCNNPVTEKRKFIQDFQRTADLSNVHVHGPSCYHTRTGEVCCRFGKPTHLREETGVEQIVAIKADPKKPDISFEVFNHQPKPLPPSEIIATFQNGLVVDYSPVQSAVVGCNTNASLLGSDAQTKAALCYVLKYVTKPPAELAHTLSLLHHARRTIEVHPSRAADTGTEIRTGMHYLNRIVNQLSGAIEISAPMAAVAIQGMPAELRSETFCVAYVTAAIAYAKHHHETSSTSMGDNLNEFDDVDTNDSAMEEENDEINSDEDIISDDEESSTNIEDINDLNHHSDHEDTEVIHNVDGDLTQDEFFNQTEPLILSSEDKNRLATQSDENIVSTANIYVSDKKIVAVPQHIHYAYRGEELNLLSLYEYVALIDVIPKHWKKQQMDQNSEEPDTGGRAGPWTHAYGTQGPWKYVQRNRSKTKIPVLVGPPPAPPTAKPRQRTAAWTSQSRKLADYILTLYRPRQVETADKSTLPGSTLWNDLCQYMHTLEHGHNEEGPSFLNRIRSKWINNAAHGLRISGEDRTAASKHRCQCAKQWNTKDGSESLRSTLEPPEGSTLLSNEIRIQETMAATAAQENINILRERASADDLLERANHSHLEYYCKDSEMRLSILIWVKVDPSAFLFCDLL
ncbi:hypothetical protein DAPPUDRAFT_118188 [Daphnia pulex]|uniref:Helitron helicase-like domain-containing protein n=1 Tax=Daphnia pulex TaxID=6669 RepID=E9HV05_DAPPU|nr:hypothetical protein DAPPUDRAFT_118188 [Daphnia pulex]|eukprot:EFX64429.1 hypothetical protein DAPPUDRAFT_118188 [Daphnia pulex]